MVKTDTNHLYFSAVSFETYSVLSAAAVSLQLTRMHGLTYPPFHTPRAKRFRKRYDYDLSDKCAEHCTGFTPSSTSVYNGSVCNAWVSQ